MLLLLVFSATLWAQHEQSQQRAMASRAARMDAMRQLAEAIQGVKIDSTTTVKDFVTEKDEIKTALDAYLQGIQQVGEPIHNPDGTCEVTLSIRMEDLVFWLKNTWGEYGSDRIQSPEQFDQMSNFNSQAVFTATGSGAMKVVPNSQNFGNFWDRVTPQGKLMAQRAAQVDAYRNLAESIKGVRITSNTRVEDFVTVSDEIRASFNGFIRGAQVLGSKYHPDGYVEVTVQVDMNHLVSQLQGMCRKSYKGSQFNPNTFNQMRQYTNLPVIKAVGTGVPPAQFIRQYIPPTQPGTVVPGNPDYPYQPPTPVKPYVPEWANRTIQVTGSGAPADWMPPAQAKLMAQRAATLDAYRLLTEQIMGLQLKASTTVKDFVTENDEISTKTKGLIRGTQVKNVRNLPDGTVEVDMELYLGHIWQLIEAGYKE